MSGFLVRALGRAGRTARPRTKARSPRGFRFSGALVHGDTGLLGHFPLAHGDPPAHTLARERHLEAEHRQGAQGAEDGEPEPDEQDVRHGRVPQGADEEREHRAAGGHTPECPEDHGGVEGEGAQGVHAQGQAALLGPGGAVDRLRDA